jgi:hypothetical protein
MPRPHFALAEESQAGQIVIREQRANKEGEPFALPNSVPFLVGLAFLLLKLTRMGSCRTATGCTTPNAKRCMFLFFSTSVLSDHQSLFTDHP